MPYEWISDPGAETAELHLWPHRALTPGGFVTFIAATAVLISAPALVMLGTPVMWGILPFLLAAIAAIWAALRRNARDRDILEVLELTPDRIGLTRIGPRRQRRDWQANPYWVQLRLHPTGGPVPDYLTLSGGPREVEIGAFLSVEERRGLAGELRERLARIRTA